MKHIQVQSKSKSPRACWHTLWDAPEQRFHSFSGQCVLVLTSCCYLPNEFYTSAWACSITSAELCMCSCWISWDSCWPVPLAWPRYFLSGTPTLELSTGPFAKGSHAWTWVCDLNYSEGCFVLRLNVSNLGQSTIQPLEHFWKQRIWSRQKWIPEIGKVEVISSRGMMRSYCQIYLFLFVWLVIYSSTFLAY